MTATVTQRETLPNVGGGVGTPDSPSARAPARARLPVTFGDGKGPAVVWRAAKVAARRWWLWTSRPLSLAAMWRLSAVDPVRMPGAGRGLLLAVWRLSNVTDRLVMFAVTLAAPTGLQGPLRWLLARPTRRWGFYLLCGGTVAVLAVLSVAGQRTGKG
jgi:hypothetical protein